jgi:hypothetical protein
MDNQTGRIFAQWVNVFLWAVFKNYQSSPHFWSSFLTRLRLFNNFDKKMGWDIFWAICSTNSSGHPVLLANSHAVFQSPVQISIMFSSVFTDPLPKPGTKELIIAMPNILIRTCQPDNDGQ